MALACMLMLCLRMVAVNLRGSCLILFLRFMKTGFWCEFAAPWFLVRIEVVVLTVECCRAVVWQSVGIATRKSSELE